MKSKTKFYSFLVRSAPGKYYNYKAAAQKRVFSTSNRNPYSSDAVDSHLRQVLASFVLSTWFKFSICLLSICYVLGPHTEHQCPYVLHRSSFTGTMLLSLCV